MVRRLSAAVLVVAALTSCSEGGGDGDDPTTTLPARSTTTEAASDQLDIVEDCADVASIVETLRRSAGRAGSDVAARQLLEANVEALESYAEVAPPEVTDEMEFIAEGYGRVEQAANDRSVGRGSDDDLADAVDLLTSEEMVTSLTIFDDFVAGGCREGASESEDR